MPLGTQTSSQIALSNVNRGGNKAGLSRSLALAAAKESGARLLGLSYFVIFDLGFARRVMREDFIDLLEGP